MKNTKIILSVAVLCSFLFFSCEKNEDSNSEKSVSVKITPSNKKVINKILSQGYKLSDIIECKDFYLVQGDIVFSKDINSYAANPSTNPLERHASTNNLISTDFRVVTVWIDPSIPTSGVDSWRTAVNEAMNEWTNITGCSIYFVESYLPNPDIIVKSDNNTLPNNVIASAGFPENNKAYFQILINLDFNSNVAVSESSKKYNMAHELGHCIGFRHTNWDTNGEGIGVVGANYIPNTPSQDSKSVMNGGTANFVWNGFSTYDIYAVKYLYPDISCNFRLVGATNVCAFDQYVNRIDYNVTIFNSAVLVGTSTWSISGNLEIASSNNNGCKVRVISGNTVWPATGTVSVTNNGCTKTFNVILNNCIDYSYSD